MLKKARSGPLDTKKCPQAKAIASNPDTLVNILEIRELKGYKDNNEYSQMVKFILETSPINMSE